MIAGQLEIQLLANMARLSQDINQGKEIVTSGMAKIESAVGSAKAALASLGVGIGIVAIADYAKGLVEAAAEMGRLSERTGIAVGRLSELKYAAELAHVEMGQFGTSMSFFEKTMVAGTDSSSKAGQLFKALGVDITQGPNVALTQFAERASAIDDAAVKTAAFRAVFGKAGAEMIEWAANLKATTDEAKRLGLAMDPLTTAAAKLLEQNLKALQAQSAALTLQWMSNDVGALASMAANIEKAAESGSKWLQILKEIGKLLAATGGALKDAPGVIGQYGTAMDKLATSMFATKPQTLWEQMQAKGTPAASGPKPDSATIAGILAGGRRKVDNSAARELARLQAEDQKGLIAGIQAQMDADDAFYTETGKLQDAQNAKTKQQNDLLAQQAQAWLDIINPLEPYQRQMAEISNLYVNNKLSADEWSKALGTVSAQMDAVGKVPAEKVTDVWKTAAKDMQRDMSSFFFDVMTGNMKNMGQRFTQYIAKMVADTLAARASLALLGPDFAKNISSDKPIGGLIGSIISQFSGYGSTAGMTTGTYGAAVAGLPAYASGTDYVPQTGLALIHQGERIIPASANDGGSAPNVTVQVVNQTSQPVNATQSGPAQFDGEKWVIGVVLNAMQNNPSVRNALRG